MKNLYGFYSLVIIYSVYVFAQMFKTYLKVKYLTFLYSKYSSLKKDAFLIDLSKNLVNLFKCI